jgi:UDP-glucose 4-epimerase
MAKVLVTGGSGFVGSHIADALTKSGHEVTVLDVKPSAYLMPEQKMVVGSIVDESFINKLFTEKFHAVYHLAALADLNDAKSKPRETVLINILGTVNLLEACVKYKVNRFIFGSSVYVYSQHGGFYRCSKQACENYIEEFQNRYGLDFTILRFGSLYGTRTNESNGVYRLLRQVMNDETIIYHGSENDKREYIHAQDAAHLSVLAMDDAYRNKHLTLTGNDRLTITELFKMFGEILNKEVKIAFKEEHGKNSGHYSITPYTFTPKLGKKLVSNEYVDMGQGLIQVIEMIHNEEKSKNV